MSDSLATRDLDAERRRYFRIDDAVSLKYKVIPNEDLQDRVTRLERGVQDDFTLSASMTGIQQQMKVHLAKIEMAQPVVADYLKALQAQVDILSKAILAKDQDLAGQPTREVNISAVGMAFRSEAPLENGLHLEIRMLLFPSFTGILTFGDVVDCQHEPDADADYPYRISVDFSYMRESDRDLLINHVVKRQTEQLRNRREMSENSGN